MMKATDTDNLADLLSGKILIWKSVIWQISHLENLLSGKRANMSSVMYQFCYLANLLSGTPVILQT